MFKCVLLKPQMCEVHPEIWQESLTCWQMIVSQYRDFVKAINDQIHPIHRQYLPQINIIHAYHIYTTLWVKSFKTVLWSVLREMNHSGSPETFFFLLKFMSWWKCADTSWWSDPDSNNQWTPILHQRPFSSDPALFDIWLLWILSTLSFLPGLW